MPSTSYQFLVIFIVVGGFKVFFSLADIIIIMMGGRGRLGPEKNFPPGWVSSSRRTKDEQKVVNDSGSQKDESSSARWGAGGKVASLRDVFGGSEEVTMEKGREIEEKIKVFGAQVQFCQVGYKSA
jgi:hypothetical protein